MCKKCLMFFTQKLEIIKLGPAKFWTVAPFKLVTDLWFLPCSPSVTAPRAGPMPCCFWSYQRRWLTSWCVHIPVWGKHVSPARYPALASRRGWTVTVKLAALCFTRALTHPQALTRVKSPSTLQHDSCLWHALLTLTLVTLQLILWAYYPISCLCQNCFLSPITIFL